MEVNKNSNKWASKMAQVRGNNTQTKVVVQGIERKQQLQDFLDYRWLRNWQPFFWFWCIRKGEVRVCSWVVVALNVADNQHSLSSKEEIKGKRRDEVELINSDWMDGTWDTNRIWGLRYDELGNWSSQRRDKSGSKVLGVIFILSC